ncbi:OLD family endonuclease [Lewinellaceae bacterium SD302]|nr:OLD family endonuclease [Lewinellaceae bacterium SD302]
MHYLKSLTVNNYRSIKEESFPFEPFTGMIGYNNSGKTSVLSACKWLLKRSTLATTDFNDVDKPVEVTGKIVGVSAELLEKLESKHAKSLAPYVVADEITIRRVQLSPGGRIGDIKLYVRKPEVSEDEDPWASNPAGLDVAIDKIFPDPIELGALENIQEDVAKNKSTTTIGRLIAELMAPIRERHGADAQKALAELTSVIDADGDNRAEELKDFDRETSQKVNELFPDVSIKLHVPTPDLTDIFKSGTIKVYEDGHDGGRDITTLGSGSQRAIQMALIRQLAENKRGQSDSPTCTLLLIDEPELYLHPHAIEQTRIALKQLSALGYQVIFATHSAQMIKMEDAMNALLLRKNRARGTFRRKTIATAVQELVDGGKHTHMLKTMFELTHSSRILFADTVILVEGKTEKRVIPKLFEHLNEGLTLGCHRCALVPQGGASNTAKSKAILEALDLPVKVVTDMDYAFGQAIKKGWLQEDSEDMILCFDHFEELQRMGTIRLDNRRPDKHHTKIGYNALYENEETKVAVTNIHNSLLERGIWVWRRGVIESHLGIEGKDEEAWHELLINVKNQGITEAISDDDEVSRMLNWLIQSPVTY